MPQQFQTEIDELRKLNETLQRVYWNRHHAMSNLLYDARHVQIMDSMANGEIATAQHHIALAVAALMEANASETLSNEIKQLYKDTAPKNAKGGDE